MKNLKNLFLIGGLAGGLGIFGNVRGQSAFTEESYKEFEVDRIENLYRNAYISISSGLYWGANAKVCEYYARACEYSPADLRECLLFSLNSSSKCLDSCVNSLEKFAKYANETGHYAWLYSGKSDSGFFDARGERQMYLTSSKAKEILPKLIELKNIEKETINEIATINLDNSDEMNKFNSNLEILINKYSECENLLERGIFKTY